MNDILPDESDRWQYLERTVADVLASYGYGEIRLPEEVPAAAGDDTVHRAAHRLVEIFRTVRLAVKAGIA